MPGTVLINEVKFRPFIGNSEISILSTTYDLSMVLVVTSGVASASTDTTSVAFPTSSLICPTSNLVLTSRVTVISAFLNPAFSNRDGIPAGLHDRWPETAPIYPY